MTLPDTFLPVFFPSPCDLRLHVIGMPYLQKWNACIKCFLMRHPHGFLLVRFCGDCVAALPALYRAQNQENRAIPFSEWPKTGLLNRDFGSILSASPRKNSKTQSSLNFLQSGPRKFTKSDFSGLAPIRRALTKIPFSPPSWDPLKWPFSGSQLPPPLGTPM